MMRHCDECSRWRPLDTEAYPDCSKSHRPRFVKPRYPDDRDWGWKRDCEDYHAASDVASCAAMVFKPYIVKRPNAGCQVLFPLDALDGLVDRVLALARRKEPDA